MRNAVLSATLVLLFSGCEYEDAVTPTPAPPTPVWDLAHYSWTDVNGVAVTAPDTDDWRTDVVLDATASALFTDTYPLALTPRNDTNNYVAGFPNPTQQLSMLYARSQRAFDHVDLVLANEFGTSIWHNRHIVSGHTFNVVLDVRGITGSTTAHNYRLFYRCVAGDSLTVLQGYGDLRLEP